MGNFKYYKLFVELDHKKNWMFKKIQHHYKGVSSLNFIPKIWISLQFFYLILPWIQVKQQLNDGTEYVTLMEKHLSKAAALLWKSAHIIFAS